MNKTATTQMQQLTIRANKVHEKVCDYHGDPTRMNYRDMTCAECQDDLHEAEIWARP